jgi:hypothetical protein
LNGKIMTSSLQPLCLDLAAPNVSVAPDWEVSSADAFNALRSLGLLQAVSSTSGAAALPATPERVSLRSAFGLADEEETDEEETEADEDWDEDEWDDEDEDWEDDELGDDEDDEWDDEDEEWADDAEEDSEEEE